MPRHYCQLESRNITSKLHRFPKSEQTNKPENKPGVNSKNNLDFFEFRQLKLNQVLGPW